MTSTTSRTSATGGRELAFRGKRLRTDRAAVMAIVNRTPDSFYDHGVTFAEDAAHRAIRQAVADGADVLDIGGVPASPGPEVTVRQEIDRVLPTVHWAREQFPDVVISVDTWRHEVGEAVCAAGADLINDNWAADDPELMAVAAQYGAGYVCTHTDGLTPRTDPVRPQYADVVSAVRDACTELAERVAAAGVPPAGILIDPALDFSKNTWHSLDILRNTRVLVDTGWPVLIAMSNKTFIGETLEVGLGDRVIGTMACTTYAANAGAAMFRAHQVRETRQTLEMIATINGTRDPVKVVKDT